MTIKQDLGPLIVDLKDKLLDADEKKLLANPLVGGVILFKRNFSDLKQLEELVSEIKPIRTPNLVVLVDHEGGRIQRFQEEFSRIPPMASLGEMFEINPQKAMQLAQDYAWLIGSELLAVGIDSALSPVLDVNRGISSVIGDRAFHNKEEVVVKLAQNFIKGLNSAGMDAIGKHFPGHGAVELDSHLTLPVDNRTLKQILASDGIPFANLITNLKAIMPAHIIFPQIDNLPVTYSKKWLQNILRQKLNFNGLILSDDLFMQGAKEGYDSLYSRVIAALDAGCEALLLCNQQEEVLQLIDILELSIIRDKVEFNRLALLSGHRKFNSLAKLQADVKWQTIKQIL